MNFSAKTRVWLYAILLAAQPLAVAYGIVNDTTSGLWVNLGAAILSGGLALSNLTPDKADDGPKHSA